MKRRDIRWLLVLACNLLLGWLAGLANHHLGPYGINLYLGGLTVVYAGLRLEERHGLAAVFLTGLANDAQTPEPLARTGAPPPGDRPASRGRRLISRFPLSLFAPSVPPLARRPTSRPPCRKP